VYFGNGEGPDSVIEGFTLTSGTGTDYNGNDQFCGGGAYCDNSSPTIRNNTIFGNTPKTRGGGICCWDNSSPNIQNNTISGNTAVAGGGGGIYCSNFSSPAITSNIISGNTSYQGGGIVYSNNSYPTINNNTISGNTAGEGGGILCWYNSSSTLSNNILWNNNAPVGPEIWIGTYYLPATLTISYSDVKGGQSSVHVASNCTLNWGAGMIDADPLFVDTDDFHLTWDSPCKDTGDNSAVSQPDEDFEGDPRIAYGSVDMGADEFYRHLYFTGNATPYGDVELKFVDTPWTQIQGLIIGVDIFDPPIPGAYGDWYIKPPMMLVLQIGLVPQGGIFVLSGTIPDTFPSDFYLYFQSMMGWKLTNLCVMHIQ